jgi:hypothetical protein
MDWADFKLLWPEIKGVIESGAILFSAVAVGYAVFRLPSIVSDLKKSGDDINEKLQATLKQLNNVQREIADQGQQPDAVLATEAAAVNGGGNESEKGLENWERLRSIWTDVRDHIEAQFVETIKDGRTARRYDAIPRNSYAKLIDALLDDELISAEQAKAFKEMNSRFLSLRRRARQITPDIIRDFANLKQAALALPSAPVVTNSPMPKAP